MPIAVAIVGFLFLALRAAYGQSFEMQVIDPAQAGDCKAAGDLDGDGFPDLVVGGMPHEKMAWYRNPGWAKTVIGTAHVEFTTDCGLGDIDGDGDPDLIVPDGPDGRNLLWLENRLAKDSPAPAGDWPRHEVGAIGSWGKDVELADFDRDGRLDVAARSEHEAMIFFQTAPGAWTRIALPDLPLGEEGMASGDIDGDGNVDLIVQGAWVRNPGHQSARAGNAWHVHAIGAVSPAFKAAAADIDGDGRLDVVFSSSEHVADVTWFGAATGDPTGAWTGHVIFPQLERAHTLQVADLDGDGRNDVVVGQMHTSEDKRLMYARNLDGRGIAWQRVVIDRGGLHNGVVVDVDRDGRPDIFGANWTGNPPVRLWRQKEPSKKGTLSTDFWTPLAVTRQHRQTFGLAFADMDGDGQDDIVSGGFIYLNPGGDLSAPWPQRGLPAGMEAFAALDADGDGSMDLIAQRQPANELELFWLRPQGDGLAEWSSRRIGAVPPASHSLGAQGYRVADIVPGGKPEIAISSGGGIYFFEIPDRPATEAWRRTHVSGNPSDEGFAVADIDGDGYQDIAATTGESKRVEWYRNPGRPGGEWTAHVAGEMREAVYPDRVALADLSGDGRLDVIATEENGEASGARTFWWEQPKSLAGDPPWRRFELTVQATTHGLDAADIDRDGDIDLITGEHRGAMVTMLWLNDGKGHFTPQEIARGHESHLGSRLHDLDGDGDLDVASIAWDDAGLVWIARNDAITLAPLAAGQARMFQSAPIAAGALRRLRDFFRSLAN